MEMNLQQEPAISSISSMVNSIYQPVDDNRMVIRKGYMYKLRVNHPDIATTLLQFAGCTRFIWNKFLSMNLHRLENKQKLLWYSEMAFWLLIWKASEEYGFLKECNAQVLQQGLLKLERAFKDGFDKTQSIKRLPKFKRRGGKVSFRYPQGFKIDNDYIYLPKIGWLRFRKSRDLIGKPKNVTISLKSDGWYISIQTEQEITMPVHPSNTMVGIDMGIVKFAQLSDETEYKPLNSFKQTEKKLAREQRNLSRKVRLSNNYNKQQKKIGRIHHNIAQCRNDYLHKVSHEISENQAVIVVEDLKVSNMSRSASGNIEKPGTMVKAKSGLNKAILDQGWSEFRRQLTYKQRWRGGQVIAVNPQYTSQTCPDCRCRHVDKKNRLSQSEFECVHCGYKNNADLVGALNILAAGHAVLACGETGLPDSMKQEPIAAATSVGWN